MARRFVAMQLARRSSVAVLQRACDGLDTAARHCRPATAVHSGEVRGYGAQARWAHGGGGNAREPRWTTGTAMNDTEHHLPPESCGSATVRAAE